MVPPPAVLLSMMAPLMAFASVFEPPRVSRREAVILLLAVTLKAAFVKTRGLLPFAELLRIIAPPVAVIVVAPIVTWRLLLAAPARKFRVPSALAFPILSVPFAPKALFVPISAIPVALLTMSAP